MDREVSPSGFALMGDAETDGAIQHLVPPLPNEFEVQGEQGGELHASNGRVGVSVLCDGKTAMLKRNAVKGVGSPRARKLQWLVAELDGVRAYVQVDGERVNVVLTKQDLYP